MYTPSYAKTDVPYSTFNVLTVLTHEPYAYEAVKHITKTASPSGGGSLNASYVLGPETIQLAQRSESRAPATFAESGLSRGLNATAAQPLHR